MAHGIRAWISLTGIGHDPETITQVLGIRPTKTWKVGDLILGRQGRKHTQTGWVLASQLSRTRLLQEHFEHLLSIADPKRMVLNELCENLTLEVELAGEVTFSGAQGPEVNIPSDVVKRAACIGAAIDIDLFNLDHDEQDRSDEGQST